MHGIPWHRSMDGGFFTDQTANDNMGDKNCGAESDSLFKVYTITRLSILALVWLFHSSIWNYNSQDDSWENESRFQVMMTNTILKLKTLLKNIGFAFGIFAYVSFAAALYQCCGKVANSEEVGCDRGGEKSEMRISNHMVCSRKNEKFQYVNHANCNEISFKRDHITSERPISRQCFIVSMFSPDIWAPQRYWPFSFVWSFVRARHR